MLAPHTLFSKLSRNSWKNAVYGSLEGAIYAAP